MAHRVQPHNRKKTSKAQKPFTSMKGPPLSWLCSQAQNALFAETKIIRLASFLLSFPLLKCMQQSTRHEVPRASMGLTLLNNRHAPESLFLLAFTFIAIRKGPFKATLAWPLEKLKKKKTFGKTSKTATSREVQKIRRAHKLGQQYSLRLSHTVCLHQYSKNFAAASCTHKQVRQVFTVMHLLTALVLQRKCFNKGRTEKKL